MDIEAEEKAIRQFIDKENYHAAMNLSISAVNECRKQTNQPGIDHFIELIGEIADTMAEKFGSQGKARRDNS
ncbi:MAG: hypothetical protein WBN96_14810 [Gammaproteobacteria bacterium]